MSDECPECGTKMEKIKDWEDEWKFCPKCHQTKKMGNQPEFLKGKRPKPKTK